MQEPTRILFVEDDQDMAAIYTENFLEPEFETTIALNEEQALALVRASHEKFDVVVADNKIHRLEGIAFLRRIREDFPEVKILIVTGYRSWAHDTEAGGIIQFWNRPVKMAELKELIRTLLQPC